MAVQHRKQRERLAREQLILDAALQVFSEKGFNQATMDDVAQIAELGKGTLYYYFKSKDEIFLHLLESNTRQFFDQIYQTVESETTFVEIVQKILLFYASYFHENRQFFNIYFPYESGQIKLKSQEFNAFRKTYYKVRKPFETRLFQKMKEENIASISPENFWKILGGVIMSINMEIHRESPLQEIIQMIKEFIAVLKQGLK
ncbi:fatty acid metabolism regulator protein [bacterium BMS3Abin05]|nr:fatty acid metabolism regulator protein [bacterium BMS3Abin05]GBE27646.1 fatty acid metabolism regulator protein [bacterium BMS3Bbin03]HDK35427.1 TetR/AcrR family transcriptional regulator [Bacteroidota bacterium]HDL78414.1 TetR/AcrR family transcriptional regulator [Bacteroidota bacterium]